jgi:hypothetical protein
MARRKSSLNQKVTLRFDPKTIVLIEDLEIPVATIAAKVRYLVTRGIERVQAEKAARTGQMNSMSGLRL